MRAFIIRPFGTKQGINFDRVEAELIDPALTALEIAGRTTGEILRAGNIRTDMFQQLLVADLVIADISTNNANAFYELGIRHSLRDCHTFLLRSRNREPVRTGDLAKDEEERKKNEDVPFDLLTDRYLAYDPDNPRGVLDTLIQGLRSTIAGKQPDSPVFLALPGLEAQDQSRFTPVPQDFGEELEVAAARKQRERLALLGMEVRGFTWETAGLRAVGRKQFDFKFLADARSTWEAVLEIHPDDIEANLLLGTIYQRQGELEKSNIVLHRVLARPNAGAAKLAEAHALLARNLKQLWQDEWKQAPPEERRRCAFESPLLLEAYEQYRKAYFQDLNAYYPGINALALLTIYLGLAGEGADEDRLRGDAGPLTSGVGLSIEATKAQKGDSDIWMKITAADLRLFTCAKPAEAVAAYRTALRGAPPFAVESAATATGAVPRPRGDGRQGGGRARRDRDRAGETAAGQPGGPRDPVHRTPHRFARPENGAVSSRVRGESARRHRIRRAKDTRRRDGAGAGSGRSGLRRRHPVSRGLPGSGHR